MPPGALHDFGFGHGTDEVATEADERIDAAVAHTLAGFDSVEAPLARRGEAVLLR